jgi:hypothetical protein
LGKIETMDLTLERRTHPAKNVSGNPFHPTKASILNGGLTFVGSTAAKPASPVTPGPPRSRELKSTLMCTSVITENVPALCNPPLEIPFIEVRGGHRLRGVGRAVINHLTHRYSYQTLIGFSEADGFWESPGWSRHIHKQDDEFHPRHRALYVQPA